MSGIQRRSKRREGLRKIVIIAVVALLCAGGVALAAWKVRDEGRGQKPAQAALEAEPFQHELEEATSVDEPADAGEATAREGDPSTGSEAWDLDYQTGEDFSYTSPDQRYVTETQRHQNFFRAVAEGRVWRLEVTNADVRPVGDPNSSYIYFTLSTDSGTSNGTFVMKFDNGRWRIAAINELRGDLEGGTNYTVPASFEDDLAREVAELQPFLTKVAEGRFAYMEVHAVDRRGENETVLTGVVVGKSGKSVPAEMRLRKDYGIWHLTYITNPP